MIIYRPHRGSLHDAMLEKKEFNTVDEMKQYIIDNKPFDPPMYKFEDIVLSEETHNDQRIDWYDVHYVCVKGYYDWNGNYIDYMKKYNCPQAIGMCSDNYTQ